MKPFITGSHAYGTPTPDSDIDLVLPPMEKHPEYSLIVKSELSAHPVKYGKLNLILTSTEQQFNLWKQGTEELVMKYPVTREAAIAHFDALFESHGLSKSLEDSGNGTKK